MKNFILKAVISGGYAGYAPVLKGTAGTLLGLIIYLGIIFGTGIPDCIRCAAINPRDLVAIGGIIFFGLLTLGLGGWAEKYYCRKDPQHFVLDEFAGVFTACLFVDMSGLTLLRAGLIFCLFRLFDGLKPFPIKRSQALPAGLGILADDLIAGVYANICIQAIIYSGWVG